MMNRNPCITHRFRVFTFYLSIIKQQVESISMFQHIFNLCHEAFHLSDGAENLTGVISVRPYTYPVHSTVKPFHNTCAT